MELPQISPTDSAAVLADKFVSTAARMISFIAAQMMEDADIIRFEPLQRRFSLARRISTSEALIQRAGPVLVRFQAPIRAQDEKFFAALNIASVIKNPDDLAIIGPFLESMQGKYTGFPLRARKEVFRAMKHLLSIYASYYTACADDN